MSATAEAIYRIDIPQETRVLVETTGSVDTVVYVRTPCDQPDLLCNDDSGPSTLSLLAGVVPAGTYYLFTTKYSTAANVTYGLSVTDLGLPIGDTCAAPEPIVSSGSITGDTIGYRADIGTANVASCGSATNAGPDHVYSVEIPSNTELVATVTPTNAIFNPSIYILDDAAQCQVADAGCLSGSSTGGTGAADSARFINPAVAGPRTVLVVVDTGTGTDDLFGGPYTLDVVFNPIPPCGDGVITPAYEACDDGNVGDGDGCSSGCTIEAGWACNNTTPPSACHPTVCGDGQREGQEGCDDGNLTPGDGCDEFCAVEPLYGEDCAHPAALSFVNDVATTTGDTRTRINNNLSGEGNICSSSGVLTAKDVIYTFTLTEPRLVTASATGANGLSPALYFKANCAGTAPADILGCAAGTGTQTTPATLLQPGTYYLWVDGYGPSEGTFTLTVTSAPGPCGNGVIDASFGENCDDGNDDPGDGCSTACRTEPGFVCSGAPSTCSPGASGDTCADAIELTAGVATTGTTVGWTNDYTFSTNGLCISAGSAPDLVYKYTVQPGEKAVGTLTLSGTSWDSTFNLIAGLDACQTPPIACVAGFDPPGAANKLALQNTTANPVDAYFLVDGFSTASGAFSVQVDVSPIESGDVCGAAEVLVLDDAPTPGALSASYINDYHATGTNCSSTFTGPDRVYSVLVPAGALVRATVVPAAGLNTTLSLAMGETNCGARRCVGNDNSGAAGVADSAMWENTTGTDQQLFMVVDSDSATASGSFTIQVTTLPVTGGETCGSALPLASDGIAVSGDLAGLLNNYNGAGAGCAATAPGADMVYSVEVPAGERATITVTPSSGLNTSISLTTNVDACATRTCVGTSNSGASNGAIDELRWDNPSSQSVTLYVIVDAASATPTTTTFSIAATVGPTPYAVSSMAADCTALSAPTVLMGTGSATTFADDATSAITALGFPFSFFGDSFTRFAASTNGNIQLFAPTGGTTSTAYSNVAIPATAVPNGFIAPFWDDVRYAANTASVLSYEVTGASPASVLTVEWRDVSLVGNASDPSRLTFRAKLYEGTNVVEFHYCALNANGGTAPVTGGSATIGLESASGTDGFQYSFNQPDAVVAGAALQFTPQ